MNIYIVTEDLYFFLGLANILNHRGIIRIHFKELENVCDESCFNDVFIVDSQDIPVYIYHQIALKLRGEALYFFIKNKFKKSYTLYGAVFLNVLTDMGKYFPNVIHSHPPLPPASNDNKILTLRERAVLSYIINGRSAKSASVNMGLSLKTIYAHRNSALKKIGRWNFSKLILFRDYLK